MKSVLVATYLDSNKSNTMNGVANLLYECSLIAICHGTILRLKQLVTVCSQGSTSMTRLDMADNDKGQELCYSMLDLLLLSQASSGHPVMDINNTFFHLPIPPWKVAGK